MTQLFNLVPPGSFEYFFSFSRRNQSKPPLYGVNIPISLLFLVGTTSSPFLLRTEQALLASGLEGRFVSRSCKVLRPVLTPWQMLSSRLKLDVQILQRLSERFVSSSTLVALRVSVWRAMVGEPGEILWTNSN